MKLLLLTIVFTYSNGSWHVVKQSDAIQIFTPSLKIVRAKYIDRKMQFGPVDTGFFFYMQPFLFEYQESLKVTLYCSLDFTTFPFDYHTCDLKYGSTVLSPVSLLLDVPYIREHTLLTCVNRTENY